MKTLRVVLAGGGTGGHIMPLLAVAKELPGQELLFLGSYRGPERQLAQAAGLKFAAITTGRWRRFFSLWNLLDPWKVIFGFFQGLFILGGFKPAVVLAKGGYVALPVILAAATLRLPLVVHESDRVLGLTNRLAVLFAKKVCLGFPLAKPVAYQKLVLTGVPVAAGFVPRPLPWRPKRLLVLGGSQGAQSLNQMLKAALGELLAFCEVIHLCGAQDYPGFSPLERKGYQVWGQVLPSEMPQFLARASLILSRAGSSSLAEAAAVGRPLILVPYPWAASSHQAANAAFFEKAGAAKVLREAALTAQQLTTATRDLFDQPERLAQMAKSARQLAVPLAAKKVAEVVRQVAQEKFQ